jgi:hypothetical protein
MEVQTQGGKRKYTPRKDKFVVFQTGFAIHVIVWFRSICKVIDGDSLLVMVFIQKCLLKGYDFLFL